MIDYIVAAIVFVPALLFMMLRVNAAQVFLGLCLGAVLAQVAAGDATTIIDSFRSGQTVNANLVALVLLLLPPAITAILTIRSIKPRYYLVQLIPALGVGAAGLVLANVYLSQNWQNQLAESQLFTQIDNLGVIIIGASAFLCLLQIWLLRPRKFGDKRRHLSL